jgi:methylenetetrahydrofolate dehydrogenase (NADP+)/methenyltetrahydrofolate cyclohydrolase
MTAVRIDGKAFSEKLITSITTRVAQLKEAHNVVPGLAVILVGEDAASEVYVRNKGERTTQSGMRSIEHRLPAETTQAELLSLIDEINADDTIDGILVQLPLPEQIDSHAVIQAIHPAKDVDGFHIVNAGLLATGQDALIPCTPYGCLMLLIDHIGDLAGKHVVILGRSNIVGKPMAQLMLAANATVTIAHSRTPNIPAICREADIVIAAVGRPEMVRGD